MKLLILKDTHFRFGFKQPRGRTDEFCNQIESKINQVIEIAKKNKINSLVITGDVFDIKSPSKYGVIQIRENFRILRKLKEQFNYIYSIAGNHDLPFSSTDFKEQSFYNFVIEQKLITDLTDTNNQNNIENTLLYGIDYTSDYNTILKTIQSIDKSLNGTNKKAVCVLHSHLVPTDKDRLPFGECLTYKEVTNSLLNHIVIVSGHLHKGYQTKTITNNIGTQIVIVNPWSFSRLARDYYSLNNEHIPETVILDINTETFEVSYQTIQLKVEKTEETFIQEDLDNESKVTMNISEFVNKIDADMNNVSGIETNEMPDKVKEMIQYYLEQV